MIAPAGHTCRQRPQRMQASGFWAVARPALLQLNTPCGHVCRQRPQATQAFSSTTTRVEVDEELLWLPPELWLPLPEL